MIINLFNKVTQSVKFIYIIEQFQLYSLFFNLSDTLGQEAKDGYDVTVFNQKPFYGDCDQSFEYFIYEN
ncbi:hypothetical protein FGO68_gene4116 [Halteria grandinella]|uniref:Uncharacterized protein n=1 Tax=Halteria grandinella TaxID=5974 RepID=A0A8J8NGA4_HALGN|nr:hypothetical protein FGO68_gene4116 [Halteria grandinella]